MMVEYMVFMMVHGLLNGFPKLGRPQELDGFRENPIEMDDDLGVSPFVETPIFRNHLQFTEKACCLSDGNVRQTAPIRGQNGKDDEKHVKVSTIIHVFNLFANLLI